MADIKRADRIADRLVKKLNAPECRPFFCKCAYVLSEDNIEQLLESALRPEVKVSKNYFTKCAKNAISKYI